MCWRRVLNARKRRTNLFVICAGGRAKSPNRGKYCNVRSVSMIFVILVLMRRRRTLRWISPQTKKDILWCWWLNCRIPPVNSCAISVRVIWWQQPSCLPCTVIHVGLMNATTASTKARVSSNTWNVVKGMNLYQLLGSILLMKWIRTRVICVGRVELLAQKPKCCIVTHVAMMCVMPVQRKNQEHRKCRRK